jgi:hypothetical protein
LAVCSICPRIYFLTFSSLAHSAGVPSSGRPAALR